MILISHKKIYSLKEIPLICTCCIQSFSLENPNPEEIEEVVNLSYLQDRLFDLELYEIGYEIIKSFTVSIKKDRTPFITDIIGLEMELKKTPYLYERINNFISGVPAKIKLLKKDIEKHKACISTSQLKCPECNSFLTSQREFWLELIDKTDMPHEKVYKVTTEPEGGLNS